MLGTKKQFNLRDVYTCLVYDKALKSLFAESQDRGAVKELQFALASASKGREDAFAHLKIKLLDLSCPILNDYNPDIIPEDIVNRPGLLCISLPSSYETISYAIGNMILQDLKAAIAPRFLQDTNDNLPTAIYMDEVQTFLNPEKMLSALSQFREANCQITIAHQSGKDLNVYDPRVAETVWDNAQMKIILQTNDPDTCEKLSSMIGTQKTTARTYRTMKGPLFTKQPSFEESNREVEEYIIHPNFFKKLEPRGQAVLIAPKLEKDPSFIKRIQQVLNGNSLPGSDNEGCWQATPINLAPLAIEGDGTLPKPPKKEQTLEGLHLYERFISESIPEVTQIDTEKKEQ